MSKKLFSIGQIWGEVHPKGMSAYGSYLVRVFSEQKVECGALRFGATFELEGPMLYTCYREGIHQLKFSKDNYVSADIGVPRRLIEGDPSEFHHYLGSILVEFAFESMQRAELRKIQFDRRLYEESIRLLYTKYQTGRPSPDEILFAKLEAERIRRIVQKSRGKTCDN